MTVATFGLFVPAVPAVVHLLNLEGPGLEFRRGVSPSPCTRAVLGAAHVPSSPRSLLTLTLQAAVREPGAAGSQLMSLHKAAPLI